MTGGRHSSMLLPDDCSWMSPQRWTVGMGYRYFHSHRHFVGSEEQNNRKQQGSEVNNKVTIWDIAATYQVNNRWSVSLDVPVLSMDRWSQRTPTQVSQADGIGDINVMSRMWLFTPSAEESNQNISIGIGMKFPTGKPDTQSTVTLANGTQRTSNNDQSIQLGDGGYGLILEAQAYKGFRHAMLYASGSYLINPKVNNGVATGRRPSEAIMSVADSYLYRGGVMFPIPKFHSLAMSMGIRGEGVPVRDLIGKSTNFRRPGTAVALDPGLIYSRGRDQWSFNVPVAMYRNRQRSIPDIIDQRAGGDAAFADQSIVIGYQRKF